MDKKGRYSALKKKDSQMPNPPISAEKQKRQNASASPIPTPPPKNKTNGRK